MLLRKEVTIASNKGKMLILETDDGQQLKIPKEEFADLQEGDTLTITIQPAAEAKLDQDALARTLLNQLLDEPKDQKESAG